MPFILFSNHPSAHFLARQEIEFIKQKLPRRLLPFLLHLSFFYGFRPPTHTHTHNTCIQRKRRHFPLTVCSMAMPALAHVVTSCLAFTECTRTYLQLNQCVGKHSGSMCVPTPYNQPTFPALLTFSSSYHIANNLGRYFRQAFIIQAKLGTRDNFCDNFCDNSAPF